MFLEEQDARDLHSGDHRISKQKGSWSQSRRETYAQCNKSDVRRRDEAETDGSQRRR